ncbi:MAG TPA: hypothetical protein VF077_12600 [Nitrospiraceae bacterium]
MVSTRTANVPHVMPENYSTNGYMNLLVKASETDRRRVLIGLPVTGLLRIEFVLARYGQIIPCNWSAAENIQVLSQITPLGYNVADARNVIVQAAVLGGFEWLFFLDHDVILPLDTFLKMNEYMRDGTYPIVAGLYTTKSFPAEPLVYRGRGNSYYGNFKLGEKVWADGCGNGCTLISGKVLEQMWRDAPEYLAGGNQKVRRVYDTPQFQWVDPESGGFKSFQGTEDLAFFDRMMQGDYLAKAGFKKVAKKRYPILIDASIVCYHITQDGIKYPTEWRW